jgi:hypothetical protein
MSVTQSGGAGKVLYPLYAVRLWRMGKQLVFPLYVSVLEALGARHGDLVLVRVHLPYVTFRIANPDLTMPIPRFSPEQLPPSYKELLEELAKAVL